MRRKKRVYKVGTKGAGGVSLSLEEDFTTALLLARLSNEIAYKAALKHVGFEFLSDLKDGKANTLREGPRLPRLSNLQKFSWLERYQGARGLRAKRNPGDPKSRNKGIARALRVDITRLKISGRVAIGFDDDFAEAGRKYQTGYVKPASEKFRQFTAKAYKWAYASRKSKLKEYPFLPMSRLKSQIRVPARNFIAPVWKRNNKRYLTEFTKRYGERFQKDLRKQT